MDHLTDAQGVLPFDEVKGIHTCGITTDGTGGVRVSCYALRQEGVSNFNLPGSRFALLTEDAGETWQLESWPFAQNTEDRE